MHCIILAGGSAKPDEPLYAYTQGEPKALLDMGGRPMLERVVNAVQGAKDVDEVVVVGLPPDTAEHHGLAFARPVHWVPEQGGFTPNLLGGVDYVLKHWPDTQAVLGSSADIPTVTSDIVEAFIDTCRPWDKAVYYNFVTRETLEARFPHSNRTFSRLNGMEVAGGDMVILQAPKVAEHRELIVQLTNARKHPTKIASIVGIGTLLKFLFRRLTVDDVEGLATRFLGAPAKVVINPHAEIAMDADKPHQVDQLRAEFAH